MSPPTDYLKSPIFVLVDQLAQRQKWGLIGNLVLELVNQMHAVQPVRKSHLVNILSQPVLAEEVVILPQVSQPPAFLFGLTTYA